MSCQVKVSANIIDVGSVRRCLFPLDDDRGSDNWIQNCCLSVSPTGEIIVLAHNTRIVVLSAKWDSNAVLNQFHITFSGSLEDGAENITAVLCLPIASQNKSSQVGPDWTCIAVGFQSGHVKFYTDNCSLLFSERLHDEKVCSIKCQSQNSYLESNSDVRPEEVYIQYPTSVCMYSGTQLFPALRNFRSQLARVQAKGDCFDATSPFLCPKKWGFADQHSVKDMVVVGSSSVNTFDHLLTASMCGGFDARYRVVAPSNTLVVGVGAKPYVAFHYAIEGVAQPVLSDVAKAVANKLKSALPGWLVGTKTAEEKQQTPTIIPAEPMGCRFGLCDSRRTADTVIISPDKKLSIVTDSLGRIALIDNCKGIALRLWKGYRGANCSFLLVPDEERTKHVKGAPRKQRTALFLIIYTPKKGTIEIWALQQGPKIVTFTASKYSRLVYNNYSLVGFGNTQAKAKHGYHFSCLLIDPDGQVKEILVPFHFSLPEKNSKRTRDLHLFKKLKQFLKSEEYDLEQLCSEVVNTCSELKTNVVRLQCFDMLLLSKYMQPKAMLMMSDCFLENLNKEDVTDDEIRKLITLNKNLKLIVDFYIYADELNFTEMDEENGNIPDNNENIRKVDTSLVISEKEMNNLQRLLDLSTLSNERKLSEPKVSFKLEKKSIFSEYLLAFELNSEETIHLKNDISEDKLFRISEIIFHSFITSKRDDVDILQEQMSKSTIRTLDLIRMFLSFWINRHLDINMNLNRDMENFSKILYAVCSTTSIENICAEFNTISPFWTEIREFLTDSAKPFPALTAAILCRGISQKIELEKEQQCSLTSLEEEIWEKLTQENCKWTLLIGKLEDISLLNIILSNKPTIDSCTLPKLFYDRSIVSLKYILHKGRGSVSELVAQWLASGGIDPSYIAINALCENEIDTDETSITQQTSTESASLDISRNQSFNLNDVVFEQLNILKKQFPYSLEASAILANMSWEYALTWQKDIKNFMYLEASLKCLQHIPNAHIKQGLYNLMWTTHIRETFESTCKLINKVGKVPKEILCRQDTGLSEVQIPLFIEICSDFLDSFLDTVQQTYSCKRSSLKFENLWENGGVPLTELALQQYEINSSLLHIHYQLSLVIQMMTTFGIKQTKPIANLFDSSTLNLFFTDLLQKFDISTHTSEKKLLSARMQFLLKIICSSIETVQVVDDGLYSLDHVNWMAKCILLANEWGVDTDALRRHQVLQIFANGFNSLGEEILPSITDTEKLGPDLLAVAGKQLKQFLSSSPDLTAKIVALSPSLQRYLELLNKDWVANGTLDSITRLAEHAVRFLPETNNSNIYAGLLLETCLTLQDMEN